MRFTRIEKSIKKPSTYSTRIITRFLWLPKTINGETRWLEEATYREMYVPYVLDGVVGYGWDSFEWVEKNGTLNRIILDKDRPRARIRKKKI